MITTKYKWDNPHEWFESYLNEHEDDEKELFHLCVLLSQKLDSDQMQDLFQDDMDKDGYFRPIGDKEERDEDERDEL